MFQRLNEEYGFADEEMEAGPVRQIIDMAFRKIYFPGDVICDGQVPGMFLVRSGTCKIVSHRRVEDKSRHYSDDDDHEHGGDFVETKKNESGTLKNMKNILRKTGTRETFKGMEVFGEGEIKFEAALFGEKIMAKVETETILDLLIIHPRGFEHVAVDVIPPVAIPLPPAASVPKAY